MESAFSRSGRKRDPCIPGHCSMRYRTLRQGHHEECRTVIGNHTIFSRYVVIYHDFPIFPLWFHICSYHVPMVFQLIWARPWALSPRDGVALRRWCLSSEASWRRWIRRKSEKNSVPGDMGMWYPPNLVRKIMNLWSWYLKFKNGDVPWFVATSIGNQTNKNEFIITQIMAVWHIGVYATPWPFSGGQEW